VVHVLVVDERTGLAYQRVDHVAKVDVFLAVAEPSRHPFDTFVVVPKFQVVLVDVDLQLQTDVLAAGRLLLNSADAAEMLSISERTLWELKRKGEIPYVSVGSGGRKDCIRYAVDDLRELIQRRRSNGDDDEPNSS
jgi:hypothetical protein